MITSGIFPQISNNASAQRQLKATAKSYAAINFCAENKSRMTSAESTAARNAALPFLQNPARKQTFETAESIEQYLKTLGINAKFGNEYQANLVREAVDDFIKVNDPKMFEGLKISGKDFVSGGDIQVHCYYGSDNKFELLLNNTFDWSALEVKAQQEYDNCLTPSNNTKCRIYEGLARFFILKCNPEGYKKCSEGKLTLGNAEQKLAYRISDNIGDNPLNYAALYIAGKMSGVEYPSDLLLPLLKVYNTKFKLNLPESAPPKKIEQAICDFKTTDEAAQYLKKEYGVEAEFFNVNQANLLAGAIEDYVKLNNNRDMFRGLKIGAFYEEAKSGGRITTMRTNAKLAFTEDGVKCSNLDLMCNEAFDWDTFELRERSYENGFHNSKNHREPAYHELAHWLLLAHTPETSFFDEHKTRGQKESVFYKSEESAAGRVSLYALNDFHEFKAEYIAAKMCGTNFPKRVDELYNLDDELGLVFP